MIDPLKLAMASRTKLLVASSPARGFTCAICGAKQEPYTWRVTLPDRLGIACTGCASDKGWTIT